METLIYEMFFQARLAQSAEREVINPATFLCAAAPQRKAGGGGVGLVGLALPGARPQRLLGEAQVAGTSRDAPRETR